MNRKAGQYGIAVLLFISLFFVYRYHEILPKFPQTVHQWRQCDGSAIAMNYVHNGFKFFQPGVYNLHGNGKTVAEFPIIYYVDALLIKGFGEHHKHFIIRLVNLLISFLGALYLFKIGLLFFKKWWWSIFPALLFVSFPIITYYAATSVPDVPALSFLFIGIFYLFRYVKETNNGALAATIFFIALAGMIKSTALIAYIAICGVLFINQMRKQKSFSLRPITFLLLGIPFLATFSWIYWAGNYNTTHENVTFLMNIKPIWGIDRAYIDEISIRIKENWLQEYIYIPLFWMITGFGAVFLFYPKKEWFLLKLGIVLLLVGTAAYFYLFFEQFYHHDYYAIELLPLVIAIYMAFLYGIEQVKFTNWITHFFGLINIVLICLCIQYAAKNLNKRYTEDALHNNDKDVLTEITPLLREKGIEYSDKVIVSFDRTPNVSLFLMDQVGWTRFPYGIDEEMVKDYVEAGAKILITTSADLKERPYLEPFIKDTLFEYKNVLVFNL